MRMPNVKYQNGEIVMGRWPGSNLYYEVKVLGFDGKAQLYTVIYKDGTELELKEQDIKNAAGFQTRSRSRSRSRSPGRRRSRSRSPARTTRRSSSRTTTAIPSASLTGAPSSRRDTKLKDTLEVRLVPLQHTKTTGNESNNQHDEKENAQEEENDATNKADAKTNVEPDKPQSRYNLRRRKDDGEAKSSTGKTEQLERKEEKEDKVEEAVGPCTPLDFGGKIGGAFWLFFLPSWVFFLLLQVNLEDPSLLNFPPPLPSLQAFWDPGALGLVVLWILFQVLLYIVPVGKLSEGMPLSSGERLKYRTNGFFAMVVTVLAVMASLYLGMDFTYIYDNFLQLATATLLLSILLSVFLYIRSGYAAAEQWAQGGNSGNVLYDFFKGRELNPRIRNFDLKFFFEMRPGLIGWCLINFSMALAEMKQHGLDTPSYSMILVNLFQLLYVVDGLWNEEAILTTMDLMHDGFGFMLAFGDLVWVPFTYSLQAYYLVGHPNPLSLPGVAAILTLKLIGFYIFRKSNSEKNNFRRNPSDPKLSHFKTIPTATGKSLLVSGWWGVVRHPNYLGDLIMALAWSLPCGFNHLLPWYYMIYFIILLVHRDSRDMSACQKKYGSAWDKYCRTVRYRIIPRVY